MTNRIGIILRNKLRDPLKGEPCFGCEFHYVHGNRGICNPNESNDCIIEDMMEDNRNDQVPMVR